MCLPWTMKLKRKLIETILAFNRLIASGEFLTYCDHSQEIARISASPYVIWRIYKGKLKGLKCRWGWSLLKLSGAANNQYSCFKERSLGGLFYFFCFPLVLTNGSPVHEYEYNNKPVIVRSSIPNNSRTGLFQSRYPLLLVFLSQAIDRMPGEAYNKHFRERTEKT